MTARPGTWVLLSLSAVAAGAINSIAGGGTLLTFPSLMTVVPPVVANATSTVGMVPGALAAAWGYRREMQGLRRWLMLLGLPSLAGGVVGSLLVTRLPPSTFQALIPWLILAATSLFLAQPLVTRWTGGLRRQAASPRTVAGVMAFQFVVSVYGGYFGAGMGILMLSALGLLGLGDMHELNAVKSVLGAIINGVSVVVFVLERKVHFGYAALMAVACVVGGYLGARAARRLRPGLVRWLAIGIGFSVAAYYFYKRWESGAAV